MQTLLGVLALGEITEMTDDAKVMIVEKRRSPFADDGSCKKQESEMEGVQEREGRERRREGEGNAPCFASASLWAGKRDAGDRTGAKRPALPHQPNLQLEPKWLR